MLAQIQGGAQRLLRALEERVRHGNSVLLRLVTFPLILTLYLIIAIVHSLALLFGSNHDAFLLLYQPTANKGYTTSYTDFTRRKHRIRLASITSFVATIVGSIVVSSLLTNVQPVYAATCNINVDTVVNQAYVDSNSCQDIHITGPAIITVSSIDLLGNGTFFVDNTVTAQFNGSLNLTDAGDMVAINGIVRSAIGDTTGVNITAQNILVGSTGSINQVGRGCAGGVVASRNGYAPDMADSDADLDTKECLQGQSGYGKADRGGGAHAGKGGRQDFSDTAQSVIYGSDTAPILNGAGGAGGANGGENGGAGGGIVRLNVAGTLTVNGPINAGGGNGAAASNGAGGGSGGSIYINAGTLAGSNSISANGGNGSISAGGGGGGRVAVYYDALSGYSLANISALKGLRGGFGVSTDGGTGSTFILNRRIDDGAGDLRITSGIDFQSGGDYARTNVTIDNGAGLSCANGLNSITLGGTGTLAMNGVNWKCNTADAVTIVANSWTTSNTNVIDLTKPGASSTWDIATSLTLNNLTYNSPHAGTSSASGGIITMDDAIAITLNSTTINSSVDWTNATSIDVGSGSAINANGKGCPGGINGSGPLNDGYGINGSGICTISTGGYGKNSRGGAAHANIGGNASGAANLQGATYGSSDAPVTFGSGGAGGPNGGETGGNGGGRIRIDTAGTLTVNGNISANGLAGSNSSSGAGGGAGGSVYIKAATLTGTNSITANGGNGAQIGGGGSGGRVAVYYDALEAYNLSNVTAVAGLKGPGGTPGNGGAGSTFILNRRTDDGSGDLRITSGIDFQSGGDYTRTNVTIDNGAALSCFDSFATLNLGASNMFTTNGISMKCSTVDTWNLTVGNWSMTNANSINFDKAGSVANWDFGNSVTLNNLTYTGAYPGTLSANGGLLTINEPTFDLTLSGNSNLISNGNLTLKNLSIDGSSKLNASLLGCPGGAIAGGAGANGYGPVSGVCTLGSAGYGKGNRGGAAHGGGGGTANGAGNAQTSTYGSNTAPVLFGSGGGGGSNAGEFGGRGGGKIRLIVANTLTINGVIQSNGGQGGNTNSGAGGGSGGSIYVTAGVIAGSGSISAVGGNGTFIGGGGGGGRAAVEYGGLSGFNTGNITAGGGAAGSGGTPGPGSAGTSFTKTLSVPSTPSITSPANNATGQTRTLLISSGAYSSDGAGHTTSDWQISDDNTFAPSDCGSGHIVFCSMNSSNLETIAVNPSNGMFQSALNSKSTLAPNTTYYVRVRHNNGAGNSAWSSSIAFTTVANNVPGTPSNTAPINAATNVDKNPTLTSSAFSDSDNDIHATSEWLLFEANDCSGTADWVANPASLTSVVVNSTNGNFNDALAGRTTLKAHTVYSFKVRHSDGYNFGSYSSCTNFTTLNNSPVSGGSVPDQNLNEDQNLTNAFNLNSYLTDPDFNDNNNLNCSATNGLTAGLGSMTVNANGSVDFALTSNANGSDTVQFSCQDGAGASVASNTVNITISAVNDAPTFARGADQIVNEDAGAQTVNGWATSVSKGGSSDETSQTLTFNVDNNNNGLFSVQPTVNTTTGNLTYTPTNNASGVATVTISLSDNGGIANGGQDRSPDQTFTITVNAVNDAPTFARGADQIVNEDAGAQTVNGWATSMSKGPSNESSQTLNFNANNDNNSLFSVQPSVDATTGNLTYTPAANAFGTTTVTVTLQDDGGTANGGVNVSAPQTFTITVNAVNDAPSFAKGADQTVNEDTGSRTVNGWATTINKGAPNESSQVLSFIAENDNNGLFSAQPSVDAATGNLTFVPAADAHGLATVTIRLQDDGGVGNGGANTSADQTFTITVNAVNDAPSFVKGGNVTLAEDTIAQSISSWATGISAGPNESGQVVSFTLSNNNNLLFSSQPALTNSGTLSFTPAANANGSAIVSILAKDNGGTSNGGNDTALVQTFAITVTAVNDAPTLSLIPDQSVDEGDQLIVNLSATDREGDAVTYTIADTDNNFMDHQINIQSLFVDNTNGTATFRWTPGSNLVGTYKATVTVTDGTASSNDEFTITVNDSDSNPIFSGQLPVISMLAGETVNNVFDLDDYFSDPENSALTYSSTTPLFVTININAEHQVSIIAPADLSVTDTITFTATDELGQVTDSNELEIVISNQGDDIELAQISHLKGATNGAGNVVIIGQDGQVLADWQAYPVGGVIPRIGLASEEVYIYTVKHRSGSTMSIYNLNGRLQRKKRISPQVHWRKLAVGNLRGDRTSDEIVTTTRRDHKLYFKVYSYHPRTRVMKLEKRTIFGPIGTNDYSVTIAQKAVHIVNNNGRTVFDWRAY